METESTAMGDKQAAYAAKRQRLTHAQLTRWVRDMVDLGQEAAPPPGYQQDRREQPVCAACEARAYDGECLCGTAGDQPDPAGETIYDPDQLRDAWFAGRDHAARAALQAAAAGESALVCAARAAIVMPDYDPGDEADL